MCNLLLLGLLPQITIFIIFHVVSYVEHGCNSFIFTAVQYFKVQIKHELFIFIDIFAIFNLQHKYRPIQSKHLEKQLKLRSQVYQHKLVPNNFICLNVYNKKNVVFLIAILCSSLRLALWCWRQIFKYMYIGWFLIVLFTLTLDLAGIFVYMTWSHPT